MVVAEPDTIFPDRALPWTAGKLGLGSDPVSSMDESIWFRAGRDGQM